MICAEVNDNRSAPEGRASLAQRFSAGKRRIVTQVPEGTTQVLTQTDLAPLSPFASGVPLPWRRNSSNSTHFRETYVATRILIADDSPIVRQCLVRLLSGHTDWEVCGEATDGEDAVCKTQELNPDLVVVLNHIKSVPMRPH